MEEIKIMTEKTGTEISEAMDNDFKYSKDDICKICGVVEKTFRRYLAETSMSNRDFMIVGSSHKQFYNENVLKQFQAWLMKNQINQGVQVRQVKDNVENNVKLGLSFQEIVASGNIEAMRELTTFAMNACAEVARNKQLEAEKKALLEQNTQLIEQKNAAEAETERIKQYNRNFHTSLYTATEVAKMLGVTPNRIGREAKNHNLKLEPLYGMLGKIKLDNGKLVDQFCYNDDAIRILKAIICTD